MMGGFVWNSNTKSEAKAPFNCDLVPLAIFTVYFVANGKRPSASNWTVSVPFQTNRPAGLGVMVTMSTGRIWVFSLSNYATEHTLLQLFESSKGNHWLTESDGHRSHRMVEVSFRCVTDHLQLSSLSMSQLLGLLDINNLFGNDCVGLASN